MWCKKKNFSRISWMLIICIGFVTLFSSMPETAYADEGNEENLCEKYGIDESFEGELIVKYETVKSQGILNRLFFSADEVDAEEVILCEVGSDEDVNETIEDLEKDGQIEYIEPNLILEICEDNEEPETDTLKDKYIDYQWALKDINAFEAWDKIGDTPGEAVVAVLDTGVDYSHPDLDSKILEGKNFVKERKDGSHYPNNYGIMDDNGHGTFASGVITATYNNGIGVSGLAGNLDVKVLAVKVMNDDGEGNVFEISEGIRYAADQQADIISLSLGGEGYSQTMANAVKYAQDNGVLVVAAAGNDGKDGSNFYPAAYSGVLTVGAVGPDDSIAAFSNYGQELDIMAPGVQIYSTSIAKEAAFGNEEDGYYAQFNGTSFSCPYTAGVAAVYKIIHPEANADAIKEALLQTAVDLEDDGWDEKTGYGKLDMYAATNPATNIESVIKIDGLKRNDYLKGEVQIKANILNEQEEIDQVKFYLDNMDEQSLIGIAETEDYSRFSMEWDTRNFENGTHELIAAAFKDGELKQKDTLTIQVINEVKSGILLKVKDPDGNASVNAFVNVYVKDVEHQDYDRVYTGKTNQLGIARISGTLGKDLSNIYVVITGTFDCEEVKSGSALFIYQEQLEGPGEFEITGENTQPVKFGTFNKGGNELFNVAYYATVVDQEGINIGITNELNPNKEAAPVVYAEEGKYDFFSYSQKDQETYFLTQWSKRISKSESAQTLVFDGSKTGQVHLVTGDETKVQSGIVYLYNDKTNASLGMKLGGKNIYVSSDTYRYKIDAEVKDPQNGEDWIYTFDSGKKGIAIPENQIAEVKVGGGLKISNFDLSYEAVEEHVLEANKTYNKDKIQMIEDGNKTVVRFPIGYELFQTLNRFADNYGNYLTGISRGSLTGASVAHYGQAVAPQEEEDEEDESKVLFPRFRVLDENKEWIYPIYWDLLGGHEDGERSKNFFEFTFWDIMSLDGKTGDYELQLSLEKNALCEEKLSKKIDVRLYDEGLHKILSYDPQHITEHVNEDSNLTVPYMYLFSLRDSQETDAVSSATAKEDNPMGDGEVDAVDCNPAKTKGPYWEQTYGAWGRQYQNEDDFGTIALDSSIKLSKEKDGNLAIIRYTLSDGDSYVYLFRQFTDFQDLGTEIRLDELNLKKVTMADLNVGGTKLDHMQSNSNIIFKAKVGEDVLPVRMPVFTEDVWVEPGQYSFDGQYITHPDSKGNQTNYYVVEKDVDVQQNQEINFDVSKNATIILEPETTGYKKWKGAALLPFSDYSHSFKVEDTQGSIYSIPADIYYDSVNVVLGLADSEKTSYVWNYLFQMPETLKLAAGEEYHLKVGGSFKPMVELKKDTYSSQEKLTGYSAVMDQFGNRLLSTRVSADHEWFDVNRQVAKQDYEIQHDTTDNANIVYPYMRLYKQENSGEKLMYNESKAQYYHSFEELLSGLSVGSYRAEIAFAGSPNGQVKTAAEDGLFVIAENKSSGGKGGGSKGSSVIKETEKETPEKEKTEAEVIKQNLEKQNIKVISTPTVVKKQAKELYEDVSLTLNTELDKEKACAISYDIAKNSYSFVPAIFEMVDGKWHVKMKITSDSQIFVVEHDKTFKDVSDHWAKEEIEKMASKFIVNGVKEDTFLPDKQVTRAEFVSMLVRALNLRENSTSLGFKDIASDSWYKETVETGVKYGLIKGYEDNSFRPNEAITRAEMAVIVERAMKLAGKDPQQYDYDQTLNVFNDENQISSWSKNSVSTMVSTGITTGRANGQYAPDENTTRAETTIVLYRLMRYIEFI
ncbi:S8 family serine peptidase [Aminipila butyrica]|uniref:S8 family serine peptidase n=1 Tax=Aminipila butyrica TaxID=433296 RepID=A0A858BV39_9FIRM|nr:S8 family serine peptidase [Aminipila butyrica]QIB69813.1 S8 family serine peptidase [Aminipila butyrica]